MTWTISNVAYFILMMIITFMVIGSFMALPLMWFHVSAIDKKMGKMLKLLEQGKAGK